MCLCMWCFMCICGMCINVVYVCMCGMCVVSCQLPGPEFGMSLSQTSWPNQGPASPQTRDKRPRRGLLLLTGNVSGSKGGPLSYLLFWRWVCLGKIQLFFPFHFFFFSPTVAIKMSLETKDHWRL